MIILYFYKNTYKGVTRSLSIRSKFGEKKFQPNQGMKEIEQEVNRLCRRALSNKESTFCGYDDCKICGKTSKSQIMLKRHHRNYHKEHLCDICNTTFKGLFEYEISY